LEACALAGADPAAAASALADFAGAGRRFERLGTTASGALVIDDYAHHPTEVAATIDAARTLDGAERVWAVFQPHLFSRTALLAREFGAALARADTVAVLDVYPARERAEDFPGVTGRLLAETAADAAGGRSVFWLPSFADAQRVLAPRPRRSRPRARRAARPSRRRGWSARACAWRRSRPSPGRRSRGESPRARSARRPRS